MGSAVLRDTGTLSEICRKMIASQNIRRCASVMSGIAGRLFAGTLFVVILFKNQNELITIIEVLPNGGGFSYA